jgi:hypothetical protein
MKIKSNGPSPSRANAEIDDFIDSGADEIGASDFGMFRFVFQRYQPSVCRQGTRQPDGAVAAERAELENAFRPLHPREEMEEFALRRRDLDFRQSTGHTGGQSFLEHGIMRHEQIAEVIVDGGPGFFVHQGPKLIGH